MLQFPIRYHFYGKEETWLGYVPMLHYSGEHLLLTVHLVDSILINVCKTSFGYLVCLVNCEATINVSSLFSVEEIVDGAIPFLGEKDAVTVAFAIKHVAALLSYPRRKRKTTKPVMENYPF